MQCPQCGIETLEGSAFCHKCGASLNASNPAAQPAAADSSAKERVHAILQERAASAQAPQEVIWTGSFSSRAMIDNWVLCGLATVGLLMIGAWWNFHKTGWLIFLAAIILQWGYNLLAWFSRRVGVRYQITTQRFIHERGILRHVSDRIDLAEIKDLRCEQGVVDRILGVGTLHIISSDPSSPELVLHGIENAQMVAGKIDEARRAEQLRRGLLIE